MFSSALKSFTSNISSNYTLSPQPSSVSGPWKIYDAKKKSTGKAASVFVFEKKTLESQGGSLGGRTNAASLKRAHEEVVERLKKEASSLARLRHPSILELAEPVEETRNGGLMFATEPVTASLAGLLQEKDEQERAGGVGGRSSRYVVEESDGKGRRRREIEIDELEIQKGLIQIGKGLEFLHESAGLVHGNLTPESIFVNAKSDWKISGLAFCSPSEGSNVPTSVTPISLSEVLNHDPRLPRSVQLNLDYTSPDFVLDNNITVAADMFSLGLLIIALYNSPHRSPLETNGSLSTYKRLFSSSSGVPTQGNGYLSSRPLPKDVVSSLLPRMITRRPAQRMTAREFQQAQYFDNILVSTIRFLDSLPGKTPNEKGQFMRGLPRILNQFPKSVLDKKVLPALLEEMKDRELLSLVLQNVFKIISTIPSGKRTFPEKVIPRLREIFLTSSSGSKGAATERDSLKEAGLMVVLENMKIIADNTSGKEFKDDILPIIQHALESPTHSLVDAALRTLPVILPVLDFSTVKNELFPVIATVFSKTSSMGIKIRGLEAFKTLCGGNSPDAATGDDLNGVSAPKAKNHNPVILDKYTIQEKVVPLLKAIKTKEPAVMMAALDVFQEVGKIADSEFLAMDVLPIIWNMSLGPLLNLQQFQAFMTLIKLLSGRIEQEQTRKLQELSSSTTTASHPNDFMSFGSIGGVNGLECPANGEEVDFESLVLGKKPAATPTSTFDDPWASAASSTTLPSRPAQQLSVSQQKTPTFSWSTPPPTSPPVSTTTLAPQKSSSRTITPDQSFSSFATLTPTTATAALSSFSQPLQSSRPAMSILSATNTTNNTQHPFNSSLWTSSPSTSMMASPMTQSQPSSSFSAFAIAPPPTSPYSNFNIAPPPGGNTSRQPSYGAPASPGIGGGISMGNMSGMGMGMGRGIASTSQPPPIQPQAPVQRQGLDKYESLL